MQVFIYCKITLHVSGVLLMMGAIDTRNMYSDFAVNKHLHTVASRWILYRVTMHGTMNIKFAPFDSIMSQSNPVHMFTPHFLKTNCNIVFLPCA